MMIESSKFKDTAPDRGLSALRDEEAGDLAYARKCAHAILKWMNMTRESAEEYLAQEVNPMRRGEERRRLWRSRRKMTFFQSCKSIYLHTYVCMKRTK